MLKFAGCFLLEKDEYSDDESDTDGFSLTQLLSVFIPKSDSMRKAVADSAFTFLGAFENCTEEREWVEKALESLNPW